MLSILFLLKLTIVPLFIGLVTLAGRRYGDALAGLLGGLPVVAGPIVVFMLVEQGSDFGAAAALSAMSAVICLLCFNFAYSWSTRLWFTKAWWGALGFAWFIWFLSAVLLSKIPTQALLLSILVWLFLVIAPYILPKQHKQQATLKNTSKPNKGYDLPLRMLSGALLTILVTSLAATLGTIWSGLLAVFPIIGTVLAVFTHIKNGSAAVIIMHHGMVQGLYSLAIFFGVLYAALTQHIPALWAVCLAIMLALLLQVLLVLFKPKKRS